MYILPACCCCFIAMLANQSCCLAQSKPCSDGRMVKLTQAQRVGASNPFPSRLKGWAIKTYAGDCNTKPICVSKSAYVRQMLRLQSCPLYQQDTLESMRTRSILTRLQLAGQREDCWRRESIGSTKPQSVCLMAGGTFLPAGRNAVAILGSQIFTNLPSG